MKRKLLMLVIAGIIASPAMAISPMGSPTAGLEKGKIRLSFDYAYSDMNIKVGGDKTKLRTSLYAGNLGYGLSDKWEIFGRFGLSGFNSERSYSDSSGKLYGFGTKYTWSKSEKVDWGVLFQMSWFESSGTMKVNGSNVNVEADGTEIQVALGPNWKVSEKLSIYGGPFLHLLYGDGFGSSGGGTRKENFKQDSAFGGYIGMQYALTENSFISTELQYTGAGYALGTSVGWKF